MERIGFMRTLCAVSAIVFISCAGSSTTTNQNAISTTSNQIVGEVADQQITYSELVGNYGSGSGLSDFTLEELQEFLPIYLDYKAKIMSAKDDGYFTDDRILSEYDIYSKQAAYSYWLESVIRPTLFEEFKGKFIKEMKSSHVLIALDPGASPEDTLSVYTQILEARDKFIAGSTIEELDTEYSSKRQGRSMGGELPWFSVGTTVKPFEDVLYSLEVGEISMPFRTQFGYHIVLLEDERERVPSRMISHIYLQRGQEPSILDSAFAELETGSDWNEVVKKYSQDTQSAANGGKIGWVNYGSRYDGAFIDSVMQIDASLPYSSPIISSYGAHIIKIDSLQTFESEEEKDAFIMKELEDSRTFRKSNSFIVNWLKENYRSVENADVLDETVTLFSSLDSTEIANVMLDDELAAKQIYSFDEYTFTTQHYLEYLISAGKGPLTANYNANWFIDFQEYVIDENLSTLTLKELPEFSEQTEKYKSGLVVYQVNEDSVWSAATVDSTELMALYDASTHEYSYDQRYYYHMITSSRDTLIHQAITYVNEGNHPDSIRKSGIAVGVVVDSTGAFQGEPFDTLNTMSENSFSDIFEYNNRKAVFYLNAILEPRKMSFDEAFNKLLADYQPIREELWLTNIRAKYDVKLYPENLELQYRGETSSE